MKQNLTRKLVISSFTLSSFDDQERNLTFVKTAFQVLKLKFFVCSMKQAFYSLHFTKFRASLTTIK